MHFCRNLSSDKEPGGLISFSEALVLLGVKRKKGTKIIPNRDVKINFLLDRSTDLTFSGVNLTGNSIALVGQIALHVKQ
jgi:hypothetical protein